MTEIQRVVDELRFVLQREVVEQTDELAGLVRSYSAHCHDANLRLRRCDECLKQGLRSEALQLAEATPNLLDVIAILDFAERDQLIDVVNMYFFTPPEPLLLDVASTLNEAYAQHEPLQKLLDSHRLLALGRSPLPQRLSVLRSLATLDEASPHWDADVREMERARLRELESAARSAAQRQDAAALKTLLGEVQSEGWREAIPASLLRELKSRAGQAVRGNARQRMEELNPELYAAFSALDADRARPLRDEWNQKQQVVQAPASDPLCEEVAPIFDWLDDEDRKQTNERTYTKAVADIERAIENDNLSSADLKRLGLVVDRLDRGLPPSLDMRYRNRLATLDVGEGRQRKLKIGAGAAAVAVVLGVLGIVVNFSMQAEETRRVTAAVGAYLDDGKIDEARKLMEQRPPASPSEAWLAMQKRLVDAEQSERDRAAQWQAEIETVHESTEPARIEAALKQARELARTTDEKIEVGKQQSQWQQRVRTETAARELQFREEIASASKSLQALDTALGEGDAVDEDRLRNLLETAESRVAPLRTSRSTVARELASQAELLDSRLAASRKTATDLKRKQDLLNKLTEAALILPGTTQASTKAGGFESTLRELVAVLPNDPRVATFKAVAESSPLPSVLARQKLVDRWKKLRPNDDKDAETRVREIRAFLTEHPASPDRERLVQYETWLSSIRRRFADEGDPAEGVKSRMAALFNSKFIKDGHTLRDNEGRTYYLPEAPAKPFGDIATFQYFVGFNGEKKSASLKPTELLMVKSAPPPQQELATKIRTTIRDVGLDDWSKYFREQTEMVLKADKVDPFLRYLLVLKLLEFASMGDQMLEQELTPVLEKLSDDELDRSIAWMDPNNRSAVIARIRAEELLRTIPTLEPLFARATMKQEQFERDVFALRFSVGWLEKTPRGEWVCRTKWTSPGDHLLFAAAPPDASGARTWREVGRISNKTWTLHSATAQSVGELSVVFAAATTGDAKTARVP